MSNSKILFRDGSSKLISGFLSLIRMSDFILLGGTGDEIRFENRLYTREIQREQDKQKKHYIY